VIVEVQDKQVIVAPLENAIIKVTEEYIEGVHTVLITVIESELIGKNEVVRVEVIKG
jgi:hypothetical protein